MTSTLGVTTTLTEYTVVVTNDSGERTEATGKLVFGPLTYGNTFSASNSTHGRLPNPPSEFEVQTVDLSGGKNYVGWIRVPSTWGA